MAEQPFGHLDNQSMQNRFKHLSRPINYTQRQKPKVVSDISDQFIKANQVQFNNVQPQAAPTQSIPRPTPLPSYSLNNTPQNLNVRPIAPVQAPKPVSSPNLITRPQIQVNPQAALKPVQPTYYQPQPQPQQQLRTVPVQSNLQPKVQPQPQPQLQTPVAPILNEQARTVEDKPVAFVTATDSQSAQAVEPQNFAPEQRTNIPIYLNNYNGQYEDKKISKLSPKRLTLIKGPLVWGSSIAMTIALAVSFVVFMNWNNNRNVAQAQSVKQPTGSQSSANYASINQPSQAQINSYSVGANDPKYLIIPQLNVFSMITPITLNSQNNLDAPGNIHNIGWWQSSSQPGSEGATILDGFTSNGLTSGALYTLSKLQPNSTFQVETGNSNRLTYKVVSSTEFGTNGLTMEQAISPINPKVPGLNIITCSGQTLTCPSTPNDDFVVFAELVTATSGVTATPTTN